MSKYYEIYLDGFTSVSPSREEDICAIELDYGISLPEDYRQCLLNYGGGEGFVGKRYLMLWNAGQIIPYNAEYEIEVYAPGLLVFGSSGGGEGYAFDLKKECKDIVAVPFVGVSLEDAISIASSFTEFLEKLNQPNVT